MVGNQEEDLVGDSRNSVVVQSMNVFSLWIDRSALSALESLSGCRLATLFVA